MPKTVKKTIKKKTVKKSRIAIKKPIKKKNSQKEKLIGKVTHYFSNIGVAVVVLSAPIKAGDNIKIIGGQETNFKQVVRSIQVEHREVKSAKKGQSVGIKVKEKVREGYTVFKA